MKKIFVALVLMLMIVVPLVSAQASTLTGPMPCSQTIVGVTPFDNRIVKYFDLKRQIFFGQQGFEFPCDQVVKNTLYEVNGLLNCDDFGTSCTTNADCDPLDNLPNDDFVCVNDRCLETCTVDGDCSAEGSCELFPDDENYCVDLCSNGDFNPYDPSCCCTLQENFNNELNDPALLKQLTQEDRDIVLPGILEDLQDDLNCLVEVASPLCSNGLDDDGDGDIDCADSDCINANTQCVPEHNSESSDVENGQIGLALSSQLYFNKFKPCAARAIKGLGVLEQIYSKTSGAFFIVQKLEELETELIHKLALNDENAQKFFQVNQFTCNTQPINAWTSKVQLLADKVYNCQDFANFANVLGKECELFGGVVVVSEPEFDVDLVTPEEACVQENLLEVLNEYLQTNVDAKNGITGDVPTFSTWEPVFVFAGPPVPSSPDVIEKKQIEAAVSQIIRQFDIITDPAVVAEPVDKVRIEDIVDMCSAIITKCVSNSMCDDTNDCTTNVCDISTGKCKTETFAPVTTPCPCADDNFGHCTGIDGTCVCPGAPAAPTPQDIEVIGVSAPTGGPLEFTVDNFNDLGNIVNPFTVSFGVAIQPAAFLCTTVGITPPVGCSPIAGSGTEGDAPHAGTDTTTCAFTYNCINDGTFLVDVNPVSVLENYAFEIGVTSGDDNVRNQYVFGVSHNIIFLPTAISIVPAVGIKNIGGESTTSGVFGPPFEIDYRFTAPVLSTGAGVSMTTIPGGTFITTTYPDTVFDKTTTVVALTGSAPAVDVIFDVWEAKRSPTTDNGPSIKTTIIAPSQAAGIAIDTPHGALGNGATVSVTESGGITWASVPDSPTGAVISDLLGGGNENAGLLTLFIAALFVFSIFLYVLRRRS